MTTYIIVSASYGAPTISYGPFDTLELANEVIASGRLPAPNASAQLIQLYPPAEIARREREAGR